MRTRHRSPARGVLIFVLGALVGGWAVHALTGRGAAPAASTSVAAPPFATSPAMSAPAEATAPAPATPVRGSGALLPPPAVRATGTGPAATVAPGALLIPVQGVTSGQLVDTFTDARGEGRVHDAIDIMAAAGTPVVAVADGPIEKLFLSERGGVTLYQFNSDASLAYYYAHLQSYAPGITEGQSLRRGQLLGYVGSTGNANPAAPHLHFAVFRLGPDKHWWEGDALNPYPMLGGTPR